MRARVRPAAFDAAPLGGADALRSRCEPGDVVGDFVLERRLHAGAYAEVWRAGYRAQTSVALKIAAARTLAPVAAAAWLQREHRVLAGLAHPGIVRVCAFVEERDCVALATEYLAGGDFVSLAGAAPRAWACAVEELIDALDYLHARGWVYRDLKARNVMFDDAGHARLIDFGSAAPIGSAVSAGGTTLAHRSALAGRVSPEHDVYALAVLISELLAGRLPVVGAPSRPRQAAAASAGRGIAAGRPLLRQRAAVVAIEDWVSRTLAARDPNEVGPLAACRDRIKSLIAEESNRS